MSKRPLAARAASASKALLKLGPEPLALYGLYRLGLATGHYRRLDRGQKVPVSRRDTIGPAFPLPDTPSLLKVLGKRGKAALLKQADEIVRGKVRLFGGPPVPLRLTFSGPLRHWTDYATGRASLPVYASGGKQVGDIKYLWEPARFGWAFTLGRAYHASGNPKYTRAFWSHFDRFQKGNPAYLGPHWMSGQEVAIRLMALVWCAQVFSDSSTPRQRFLLSQSVAEHAARIPSTLVYARSQNNNHLITEAAAVYTAGCVLDHQPWRDLGWRWLNHALQHQISSYGEYIQHSTNYHRLMLQAALWVDAIVRMRQDTWPSASLQALMRAAHWLFSMLDPASGRTPNLGANDGALILPLSSAAFEDYRPTVQAAARAFLRTSLPAGPWDELSLWLGLPAARHTADPGAYAAEQLRGRNAWAHLRASSFKSRLSHMDQLHFDLWWRGSNVAQDAGTYLYNAAPPWNNPLVSTRVHNTVTVDGRDQMTRGGRFLTLDWSPAYSKSVLTSDDHVLGRMLAYHRGYLRLGVRHERVASILQDGRWEVRDNLVFTKQAEHVLRLHWLLLDGPWRIEERDGEIHLRVRLGRGWLRLRISGSEFTAAGVRPRLARAGQVLYGQGWAYPYEGWISPTYGQKLPALSLAVEGIASRSCSFVTEFLLPP